MEENTKERECPECGVVIGSCRSLTPMGPQLPGRKCRTHRARLEAAQK